MGVVINWRNISTTNSRSYVCGYCGNSLASEKGFVGECLVEGFPSGNSKIYICHYCHQPTYFDILDNQTPGFAYGNPVNDISESSIEGLYNEARKCVSCGSYTGAVLCCRKLLMHIAVSKGAKVGLSFLEYINYLSDKGFIPPDGKEWVGHIREKGNEANHEIVLMKPDDAKELIDFIEMLLKFIFEFPGRMKKKKGK